MDPSVSIGPRQIRQHRRLCALVLATSAVLVIGAGFAPRSEVEGAHHTRLDLASKNKHHPKAHTKNRKGENQKAGRPCLEGNWNVTSLTLSTSGLSFTGGAGTTVDIMSNGNALGNFTPGTPLTGSEGSAKFNGTITDHYGFSPKTTARSGTFPVTPVTNNATITVAGVTRPVSSVSEQGSYTCTGKDLSLTFTSGGSTLTYQMTPA